MAIKPLAVKATVGLIGLGGMGALARQGYVAWKNTPKEMSISAKLEEEKYTLLSKGAGGWDAILADYRTVVAKDASLKFDNFDGNEPAGGTPKAVDKLKEKCENAKKQMTKGKRNELLKKARKWCVTPVKASALLTNRGFTVLPTNGDNTIASNPKWKQKIDNYKVARKGTTNMEKLFEIQDNGAATDNDIAQIKTKCATFGETLNHKEEFEKHLQNVELWCADK
ncbi:hypothetical protein A6V39_03765 [Candidatus Mycoplasma haematobovis]|uniref:Uncharacterized protein n=1 Tax=Candidatus Mycoplasma haematobovis TaxID=432608 RepID=A0A1A9QD31_9MOLU|nr:hypothetical protein [Candidatus Mycoplasma haematobovis]OAL10004.1 hypothetical protein A6V39_03765 [Candidatus Mycoplasma haematobovis]